jgi:hypothetical protein
MNVNTFGIALTVMRRSTAPDLATIRHLDARLLEDIGMDPDSAGQVLHRRRFGLPRSLSDAAACS